jgi:hypothetical protein
LREDYANGSYGVGPFEQAPAASVEPLEFNRVACGDGFDRPEPTCAVACEHQISRLPQGNTTAEARGAESQRSRCGSVQNNFVVTQARDSQARNRVSVGPRPRGEELAIFRTILPGAADQDSGKLGLSV